MAVEFAKIACRCLLAMQAGRESQPKWYLMPPWNTNYTGPPSFSGFEVKAKFPTLFVIFTHNFPLAFHKASSSKILSFHLTPIPHHHSHLIHPADPANPLKLSNFPESSHGSTCRLLQIFQGFMVILSIMTTGLGMCFRKGGPVVRLSASCSECPSGGVQLGMLGWQLLY